LVRLTRSFLFGNCDFSFGFGIHRDNNRHLYHRFGLRWQWLGNRVNNGHRGCNWFNRRRLRFRYWGGRHERRELNRGGRSGNWFLSRFWLWSWRNGLGHR
jgi:hypothetical protein